MGNGKQLDAAHWQEGNQGGTELPSRYQLLQVVNVRLCKTDTPLTATVRGVHFYPGKVKYDLGVWSTDDTNTETRIYNVDSIFVEDAFQHSAQVKAE
jgi:hypothetical protein